MNSTIQSKRAPAPVGPYPHARRHGNLLFLSGLGPRPPGGGNIPGVVMGADDEITDYDIAAQTHAVFDYVRRALEDAGAAWSDLLDITVFLTDIKRDFKTINRIYGDYFDTDGPCRTTVEVNRLPTPIAIELKCIAALRD